MSKLVVPSIWIGTALIVLALIFRVGGTGSVVGAVFCVLFAGLTTMAVTDPERKWKEAHPGKK